jgi:hypothetical protein
VWPRAHGAASGAKVPRFVILLLSGAGGRIHLYVFVVMAARRHLMAATRRRLHVDSAVQEWVMKWPKVVPRCRRVTSGAAAYRWFTACCGTILRHRQRSAADEQRDDRETFHGGHFLPRCLSHTHPDKHMRTPLGGRPFQSNR